MQVLTTIISRPLVFLLLAIMLVLIIVQLVLSNQLSTSSGKLSQVLGEIERLERGNRDLSVQIHQKGAISQLRLKAANLGFLEPKKFFFIKKNFQVAENLR